MIPSPGTCEIVEAEESDSLHHLKETKTWDDKSKRPSVLKMGGKYSLEDELNQLFEAIDLRISTRRFGPSCQSDTDSSRKYASKKPIRYGVTQVSSIGISESVTLKQSLRKLRISHASEMAATKRLSKTVGSSGVSEAGTIKRLYSAVVVEASGSGLQLEKGKGSLVEVSLVPENSTLNSDKASESLQAPKEESSTSSARSLPHQAVATPTEISLMNISSKQEMGPLPTETGNETPTLNLRRKVKLPSTLSLSRFNPKSSDREEVVSACKQVGSRSSTPDLTQSIKQHSSHLMSSNSGAKEGQSATKSPSLLQPVLRNNFFSTKKVKQGVDSTCNNSNTSKQNTSVPIPRTSKSANRIHKYNQKIGKKSPSLASTSTTSHSIGVGSSDTDSCANKPSSCSNSCDERVNDAIASTSATSREKGDFSQSSKGSLGEYSSSTSTSEETTSSGAGYSGSRPHMSKDLRWDAIHNVDMQHGTLGLRHFKLLKRLGCGDVGTVYLAELIGTNCIFALKVMDTEFLASRKKMLRAQTEKEILQMLDHPFLPTLFAHFTTDKFSCLVMEYCGGGDLHILRQRQPGGAFPEQAARFYVAEILLALEYLHMLGVIYRDLKPENILVREDGHIMLSDFDLSLRCTVRPTLLKTYSSVMEPPRKIARPCMESRCTHPFCLQATCVLAPCFTPPRLLSTASKPQKPKSVPRPQIPQLVAEPTSARSNSFVGTHEYLAPEIIKGEGHGNAVDWWTFGIFLYELLFGMTPFKGLENNDTLINIVLHSLTFPEGTSVSPQAQDLIRRLLIKEPEKRLGSVKGAAEIRQHPFFEGLNWALIRSTVPPMIPSDPALPLVSENKPSVIKENPNFEQF